MTHWRGWINQPSTHQPLHHMHGTRVIVCDMGRADLWVFPVSGPIISLKAMREHVSKGWPTKVGV